MVNEHGDHLSFNYNTAPFINTFLSIFYLQEKREDTVNRKTDNAMAKRKGEKEQCSKKTIYRKLNIEQHEHSTSLKPGWGISEAPERLTVPVSLVTPVVLPLLNIRRYVTKEERT